MKIEYLGYTLQRLQDLIDVSRGKERAYFISWTDAIAWIDAREKQTGTAKVLR
jgi:hypothetical protein